MIDIVEQIDLNLINTELIKSNVDKLTETYVQLKNIWIDFNNFEIREGYVKINELETKSIDNDEYIKIIHIIKSSFLFSNPVIKNKVEISRILFYFKYKNIYFYWIGSDDLFDGSDDLFDGSDIGEQIRLSEDYELAKKMFKITVCLHKLRYVKKEKDKDTRIIIWIPVKSNRDFNHNKITQTNLKKSSELFEAFVASGVTWSIPIPNNSGQYNLCKKVTIVTRYEEVEKLLIHELVHNFHIDGSNCHTELSNVIRKYKIIKNPTETLQINYDYEYSIYESYTELLSTYIYLIFSNLASEPEPEPELDTNTDMELGQSDKLENIREKLFAQVLVELLYSYNTIANIINLNGYRDFDDFMDKQYFLGNICMYEYYYTKGLMYNNYKLENNFGTIDKPKIFEKIYLDINNMIIQIKSNRDKLLESVYQSSKNQKNFKYQIH